MEKVFWSPSFVVLPPWRSIDAKPLSVQILICTSGIIFGLWMIYRNLFLKICQKLDLWLPNILMPILYDELVINWITVNYLMKNLCTVLIGDILPLNSICYNSMTSKKAVENGDRLKPMTAIKLCWTYIYIHCWTPISIKCHFQGRSSRLKICYVRKDDGVDYLKPNTAIKMLVWYV